MPQAYNMKYEVVEGEHIWEFEQFDKYRSFRQYGLTVQKWCNGGIVEESSVYNICVSFDEISELKHLLQRNQVAPVALYDVVSDWLVDKY